MQNKFVKSVQVSTGDLGGTYPVPSTEAEARPRGTDETKFFPRRVLVVGNPEKLYRERLECGLHMHTSCGRTGATWFSGRGNGVSSGPGNFEAMRGKLRYLGNLGDTCVRKGWGPKAAGQQDPCTSVCQPPQVPRLAEFPLAEARHTVSLDSRGEELDIISP